MLNHIRCEGTADLDETVPQLRLCRKSMQPLFSVSCGRKTRPGSGNPHEVLQLNLAHVLQHSLLHTIPGGWKGQQGIT